MVGRKCRAVLTIVFFAHLFANIGLILAQDQVMVPSPQEVYDAVKFGPRGTKQNSLSLLHRDKPWNDKKTGNYETRVKLLLDELEEKSQGVPLNWGRNLRLLPMLKWNRSWQLPGGMAVSANLVDILYKERTKSIGVIVDNQIKELPTRLLEDLDFSPVAINHKRNHFVVLGNPVCFQVDKYDEKFTTLIYSAKLHVDGSGIAFVSGGTVRQRVEVSLSETELWIWFEQNYVFSAISIDMETGKLQDWWCSHYLPMD